MQFVLLIHQGSTPTPLNPEAWATLAPDEQQGIFADYQRVNATPGVTPGVGLQSPATATTVRVQDGETITADGPYATGSQSVDGYLIFEAADLASAVELAATIPAARYGGAIEIRPVMHWG
jgi:hypothetical protein